MACSAPSAYQGQPEPAVVGSDDAGSEGTAFADTSSEEELLVPREPVELADAVLTPNTLHYHRVRRLISPLATQSPGRILISVTAPLPIPLAPTMVERLP